MSFAEEIRRVMEIERAGHERLAGARRKAEKMLEEGRASARRLAAETEKEIARRREVETARSDEAAAGEIDAIRQRTAAEARRLRDQAEKAGESTVERVMGWLWEEH
jgi:vacuolar-type H+-ATPase subunit H